MNKLHEVILGFIIEHHEKKGYSPTMEEVAEACGMGTRAVAKWHMENMRREGLVSWERYGARTIVPLADVDGNTEGLRKLKGEALAIAVQEALSEKGIHETTEFKEPNHYYVGEDYMRRSGMLDLLVKASG